MQRFKNYYPQLIRQLTLVLLLTVGLVGTGQSTVAKNSFDHNHQLYSEILQSNVKTGMVNYKKLKKTPKSLNAYLFKLSRVKKSQFNQWSKQQQLAFLINLYNATTLKLIIDHYPLTSIKRIGNWLRGPWDQPVVKLFGKRITLNNLEHQVIRQRYNEPRIHLALVCAAKGCPVLRNEAYTAKKLNAQLNSQTKQLLRNPFKFRIDRQAKIVYISPIFKWYGGDFISKYSPKNGFNGFNKQQQSVMNFCSKYLAPREQQLLRKGGYSIKFLSYDWSLNEPKGR